jgi:hypothetical protein
MPLGPGYLNFRKNRTSKLVHSGLGFSTVPEGLHSKNSANFLFYFSLLASLTEK